MIIGINSETASENRDKASLRSLSFLVSALCFTRIIPAGMINAIRNMLRVQKPAAARTEAATIATSTSLMFFILWKTFTAILKKCYKYRIDFNCQIRLKCPAEQMILQLAKLSLLLICHSGLDPDSSAVLIIRFLDAGSSPA